MTTRTPSRPTYDRIGPGSSSTASAGSSGSSTPSPGRPPAPSARGTHAGAPARHRIELSATQLIASAFAAVTTTVAASYLGVTGTVVGAALASVLTVTGNAVYGFSLRRTHERVRAVVPQPARRRVGDPGAAAPPGVRAATSRAVHHHGPCQPPRPRPTPSGAGSSHRIPTLPSSRPRADRHAPRRSIWRSIALGSVVLFTGVLAVVTTVEVVAGRPLSDVLRGDTGSGTTLFGGGSGQGPVAPQPAPTVTRTVTPSVQLVTPTVTQTAPPRTVTTTPTATVTGTPSAPATSSPTASPTAANPTTSTATGSQGGSGGATPLP